MNLTVDPEVKQTLGVKRWRLEHLYKIVDKEANLIFFKPNQIQLEFNDECWYRNIILKARQLGFTTNACIDGLDDVLFNNNFTMVIIAHEKDAVTKIFKKVRIAWDNFPQKIKDKMGYVVNTDSANELSFNNGSSIRVALSTRADTVNRLHISEFGKICKKYPMKAEEIISGAIPSVPEGGRIDIESTAEGDWGAFHDMFWESWETVPRVNKEYKAFFYPWTLDEGYRLNADVDITKEASDYQLLHKLTNDQIRWYYIEKKTQKDNMMREYPTTPEEAFASSGTKLFNNAALEWQKQFIEDGKKLGDWTWFRKFKASHRYAMASDVAEGVGQDSSTAILFDFTTMEQVAEFRSNKIAPDLLAHELRNWGDKYGFCIIAVERNNHGHTTLASLKHIYDNIYTQKSKDKVTEKDTKKLGWLTTMASKPKMLYELSDAINEKQLKIHSKALLQEFRTYDKEDLSQVRFDSEQTKHWDLLIAMAICWQMRTEASGSEMIEVNTNSRDFDPHDPL